MLLGGGLSKVSKCHSSGLESNRIERIEEERYFHKYYFLRPTFLASESKKKYFESEKKYFESKKKYSESKKKYF